MSESDDNSPQREVANESEPRRESTEDIDLSKVIRVQSLLHQFSNPEVRSALLEGRFDFPAEEATLLQQIDQLRWILLPAYEVSSPKCCDVAARHFNELLAKSSRKFVIGEGDVMSKSYAAWYKILELLSDADFWRDTPLVNRCVHFSNENIGVTQAREPNVVNEGCQQGARKKIPFVKREAGRSISSETVSRRAVIETITISDSEEDASTSEEEIVFNYPQKIVSTKVVKPNQFIVDGQQHLKDFLSDYEHYFNRKFVGGSSRECARHLGDFLSGEVKEVYSRLCTSSCQYSYLKTELLRWYKTQKIGKRSYWRRELRKVTIEPGEKLYLYGMRLMNMAQQGYENDKECAREAREQFLRSVPGQFSREVRTIERHSRIERGYSYKLPWKSLMGLARDMDETSGKTTRASLDDVRAVGVRFAACHVEDDGRDTLSQGNRPDVASSNRGFAPNRRSSHRVQRRRVPNDDFCMWCGKYGHLETECRTRQSCYNCNEVGHFAAQCPKKNRIVRCPLCQGKHLGKDCTQRSLN
jgi:hypothetical protein